jgi:hypothetical protein
VHDGTLSHADTIATGRQQGGDVAGSGALPNLVIVGVSKAGTTTLFDVLARHPQVCPSSTKETRYFQAIRYGEPLAPVDTYRAYFRACAGRPVVMECTPDYFYGGAATATAIRDVCDDPRVVVILREPVARVISFFRFLRARLQLPADMTLEDYVARCATVPDEAMNERANNVWTGVWGGHYERFLPAWLDEYGDRCRVEFFDDLVADPATLVGGLCDWLGIDPVELAESPVATRNATVAYRSPVVQRAAARLAKAARPVLHRYPRLAARARAAYETVNERPDEPEPVPDRLREDLRTLYAPGLLELRDQLTAAGVRRLPPWLAAGSR